MPKMKSNRSAAKRFSVTGSGRVKRGRNELRHKLTHKSAKRKRHLASDALVHASEEKRVKRLILA